MDPVKDLTLAASRVSEFFCYLQVNNEWMEVKSANIKNSNMASRSCY